LPFSFFNTQLEIANCENISVPHYDSYAFVELSLQFVCSICQRMEVLATAVKCNLDGSDLPMFGETEPSTTANLRPSLQIDSKRSAGKPDLFTV
jgi:hypothetical protein